MCPNISLIALNGSSCSDGELVLTAPSTIAFNCSYDNYPSTTIYTWYMDGQLLPESQFQTHEAYIHIPAGLHTVTCGAVINQSAECECEQSQTLNVTVIGTTYEHLTVFDA